MRRPTVLHVVEHWTRPSESFVADTVRSTTATRAVVAAQRRIAGSAAQGWAGPVHDLSGCPDAAPADPGLDTLPPRRRAVLTSAGGRLPVRTALAGIAVAERAAVLHAHFGQAAQPTWRAARRLGRPFSVALHGWDLLVGAGEDPGIGEAVRAADLVVVPSRFLAGHAVAAGVSPDRLRVVPSGLDLAGLPFRARTGPTGVPVVTFAGRFAPKKGVLEAARALAAAREAGTPLRAVFVGHGPLAAELRALLAELKLDAEIRDGRAPGAVVAALAATDVVLTASHTAADGDAETLGLVNLQAQACGAPLVSVRHGGIGEAVAPAGALLVDEASGDALVGALAAAVGDLLARPGDWAAMGRAGRAHVAARYELGARTAELERLWLALAAGRRGAELPEPAAPVPAPRRVSVVLVTHDRLPLVTRTLDALAAQTRPADEVLVVDNGSTDGTAALLAAREAAADPPGLRVLTRPGNLPVAEGRNLAVAAATGDVLAFTDDDCRPRPTWLEGLLAGFGEGVGLVQGRTTADPAQPLEPLSRTQWTPAEFGLYETCNVAYTRDALAAAPPPGGPGPFDLAFADVVARALGRRWARYPFGEDTELGWRVRRAGAQSRFAVHAVVDHEVSPPDPGLLVRRAALAAGFPVLVRRVPELRETFLWHRVVLGPQRAALWLALAGVAAAAAGRDPRPLLAVAPYADRVIGPRRPGRRARLAAAPTVVARDLRETRALVAGSVRARSVVL